MYMRKELNKNSQINVFLFFCFEFKSFSYIDLSFLKQ